MCSGVCWSESGGVCGEEEETGKMCWRDGGETSLQGKAERSAMRAAGNPGSKQEGFGMCKVFGLVDERRTDRVPVGDAKTD